LQLTSRIVTDTFQSVERGNAPFPFAFLVPILPMHRLRRPSLLWLHGLMIVLLLVSLSGLRMPLAGAHEPTPVPVTLGDSLSASAHRLHHHQVASAIPGDPEAACAGEMAAPLPCSGSGPGPAGPAGGLTGCDVCCVSGVCCPGLPIAPALWLARPLPPPTAASPGDPVRSLTPGRLDRPPRVPLPS
jgi:hypothetical protein